MIERDAMDRMELRSGVDATGTHVRIELWMAETAARDEGMLGDDAYMLACTKTLSVATKARVNQFPS